jgi:FkbM family methyltransferase
MNRYTYFPVALGRGLETRTLHITSSPACSSLFVPNHAFFGRFLDCGPLIEVTRTFEIQTVSLDSYLSEVGVPHIDFIELDTQGNELDILQGAANLLSEGVVGLKVEVEFSPMYLNQPLFSDVDGYIRKFEFMLFDLSRHRYRRKNYPRDMRTRGQMLYGHAFYLRDYECFARRAMKTQMMKLAVVAAFYGFHDYALEVMDCLLQGGAGDLSPKEAEMLGQTRADYLASLSKDSRLIKWMMWLEKSSLKTMFHWAGHKARSFADSYSMVESGSGCSWRD